MFCPHRETQGQQGFRAHKTGSALPMILLLDNKINHLSSRRGANKEFGAAGPSLQRAAPNMCDLEEEDPEPQSGGQLSATPHSRAPTEKRTAALIPRAHWLACKTKHQSSWQLRHQAEGPELLQPLFKGHPDPWPSQQSCQKAAPTPCLAFMPLNPDTPSPSRC